MSACTLEYVAEITADCPLPEILTALTTLFWSDGGISSSVPAFFQTKGTWHHSPKSHEPQNSQKLNDAPLIDSF
jgi:hypothetical protein